MLGDCFVTNIENGIATIETRSGEKKRFMLSMMNQFFTVKDERLQKLIDEEREKKPVKKELSDSYIDRVELNGYPIIVSAPHPRNPLIGPRSQGIEIQSKSLMFEIVGYIASPGRIGSIEAEVPKDGRDKEFERLFPGQTYRPIELGDTPSGMPNKVSSQFRINFNNTRNCPEILRKNMGVGNGSCVGRINKSKFVIDLVSNYGFKFGYYQDVEKIRSIAEKKGFLNAFNKGYAR